jgi:hypothetical protein
MVKGPIGGGGGGGGGGCTKIRVYSALCDKRYIFPPSWYPFFFFRLLSIGEVPSHLNMAVEPSIGLDVLFWHIPHPHNFT